MLSRRHWLAAAAVLLAATGQASASVEDGVTKWRAGDYAGAVAEWRKPAEKGDRDAQFNLGQAYKLGRGVAADPAKAIELYRKAAAQGHQPAEANLGWLLFQQGMRDEAVPLLQKSAARGDPHSQYLLGIAHFNGDAVRRDWPRAYRLMSAAAAAGLPQAKDALASMEARMPLADRQKALAEVPARAPAKPAESMPKTTPPATNVAAAKDWRVQLGAFSNRKAAADAWTALSARHKPLATLMPFYESGETMTRLQAGPLPDRQRASEVCRQITAQGGGCFPIRP